MISLCLYEEERFLLTRDRSGYLICWNDARDMSAALRRLGFEVTTELDADRVVLTAALRQFTRQSAGSGRLAGVLRRPRHRDGRGQLPIVP